MNSARSPAGYTGEGGIGGSVSEYYTPKPIAEGVWEIMKLYGADVGNTLEPSAGTGVLMRQNRLVR